MFGPVGGIFRHVLVWLAAGGVLFAAAAQTETKFADATEMPLDRAADSYAVFAVVLPSNAIEWSDAPRTQWLLEDVTTAKPLAEPCNSSRLDRPARGGEATYRAESRMGRSCGRLH